MDKNNTNTNSELTINELQIINHIVSTLPGSPICPGAPKLGSQKLTLLLSTNPNAIPIPRDW